MSATDCSIDPCVSSDYSLRRYEPGNFPEQIEPRLLK